MRSQSLSMGLGRTVFLADFPPSEAAGMAVGASGHTVPLGLKVGRRGGRSAKIPKTCICTF